MKLRKVFHKAPASSARIPRLLTLCAFFAAGIVAGQVAQHAVTGGELADYLRSYAGMVAENGAAQASLLRVAVAYLRESTIIFLLASCSFGAVAIPLVCAWQGFTLSFAVACFAGSLGQEGYFCRWRPLDCGAWWCCPVRCWWRSGLSIRRFAA